ncbi:MAG: 3-phosphoshikimate 1-carboxyvinyltransferase [Flavobacteriales bacterium]|nr:3-phosphoshikimate 1-carboxyvinyltransferase [Flavobacteriales bacterium]
MNVTVSPSRISGRIKAPGSKSIAQRMVAGALLAGGKSVLRDFPKSDDSLAALSVAHALGAGVEWEGSDVHITGGLNPSGAEINCGESGLSSRMFAPIMALCGKEMVLNGRGSLLTRPFDSLEPIFSQLHVAHSISNGKLPLTIKGKLRGGEIQLDGSISSQFLTGLLFALPCAKEDSVVRVINLQSIPYVQMTLDVLNQFGVNIRQEGFHTFFISGNQQFLPIDETVPGDWSGASFLLVAAALCSDGGLEIENLSNHIAQADSAIIDVLNEAGVKFKFTQSGVHNFPPSVTGLPSSVSSHLSSFTFNATHCPDLFPPLVALAAFAEGITTITGAARLKHKESNRAKVLMLEFAKANIRIAVRDDEMKIYPGPVRPCIINSHNDHRIAMAAAILGLAGAKTTIRGAECVAKSFPDFWDLLRSIGARISS